MLKTFFTYEQQLNKLQQEKGLIVPDIATATETLEHLSYYSLIGGYKQLFLSLIHIYILIFTLYPSACKSATANNFCSLSLIHILHPAIFLIIFNRIFHQVCDCKR